jgi:hypothetical protein
LEKAIPFQRFSPAAHALLGLTLATVLAAARAMVYGTVPYLFFRILKEMFRVRLFRST